MLSLHNQSSHIKTAMKHQGSILEFTNERNRELLRAYRRACDSKPFIKIAEVADIIVNSPCSRFWVSEERAMVIVSALDKGKPVLDNMHSTKQDMFSEIYRRVCLLREQRPDDSLYNLVFEAVNSPAPKFYMRPRCAIELIYKIKKNPPKTPQIALNVSPPCHSFISSPRSPQLSPSCSYGFSSLSAATPSR